MAMKSKKPCSFPRCSKLTTDMYCEDHADRSRESRKSLYNSRWRRERKAYLLRNPLCADIYKQHKTPVLATVVDHKAAHKGNEELFWNEANWQPLCASCHNRKTRLSDMMDY
ncbi:HNH endonuclease [Enterococcus sp. BWM-S5]|uniref:HNH endonuclease n=2 Tax=Enterococcus larvae TaxID=2794352 RepID=A0ABS4CED9_9ENTE|nr:HNH endonuclease [Enterococcus larvae]